MHVSRLRVGRAFNGVGFGVRECGGRVDVRGERAYVAKISEWLGMVGLLYMQWPVARNGEGVSHVGKGRRVCGGGCWNN